MKTELKDTPNYEAPALSVSNVTVEQGIAATTYNINQMEFIITDFGDEETW